MFYAFPTTLHLDRFYRRLDEVFASRLNKADAASALYERKEEVAGGVLYYYRDPKTGAVHKKFSPRKGGKAPKEADDQESPHVRVREDADTLHIDHQDQTHPVSPHDWSASLGAFYGKALIKNLGAEPGRGARSLLSLVDEKLLADLEGEDEQARLEDLARKAPKVLAALQQRIEQARVSSLEVKQRLLWVMGREGWRADGRAQLVADLLGAQGDLVADNFAMIAIGAENLAGGGDVAAVHVSAAVALRDMGAGDWPDEVAKVGQAAQKELGELLGLLAQARQNPLKAPDLLIQVASSDAIHKLRGLAKAWPGLADKDAKAVEDALAQVPACSPRTHVTEFGSHCNLYVAGALGRPVVQRARYKLVEAADLITSHDPTTFAHHSAYPAGLQERRYHDDEAEQHAVMRNASDLKPDFLINTNPDGINGPPVVTRENIALGGNKRSMSTIRAYRDGNGEGYRTHLLQNAHQFGFKPQDVQALIAPVLVREVEGEHDPALLVRQLNESQTQAMDPRTLAVAQARKLTSATLESLAQNMREEETLAEFLSSQRSADFVASLSQDGLIDERNVSAYKTGNLLSRDGRVMVERVLVGHLFGDADLLARLPERTISALARSAPILLSARAHGEVYDLAGPLRLATDAYARLREQSAAAGVEMPSSKSSKAEYDSAMDRLRADLFGDAHPVFEDERGQVLLEVMVRRGGERQMSQVLRSFGQAAAKNGQNQASLFGGNDEKSAAARAMEVFHDSITRGINAQAYEATRAPQDKEKPAGEPASQKPSSPGSERENQTPKGATGGHTSEQQGRPQSPAASEAPQEAPSPEKSPAAKPSEGEKGEAQDDDEEKPPTHAELEAAGQRGLFMSMLTVWRNQAHRRRRAA